MLVLGPFPAVAAPDRPPADIFQVRRQHVPPGRGRAWGEGQPAPAMGTRLSQHVREDAQGAVQGSCWGPDSGESGTRGLVGGADSAQLWLRVPGLAPAARSQCWDRRWAAPRKFVHAGEP